MAPRFSVGDLIYNLDSDLVVAHIVGIGKKSYECYVYEMGSTPRMWEKSFTFKEFDSILEKEPKTKLANRNNKLFRIWLGV